jgi:hypothetical protein
MTKSNGGKRHTGSRGPVFSAAEKCASLARAVAALICVVASTAVQGQTDPSVADDRAAVVESICRQYAAALTDMPADSCSNNACSSGTAGQFRAHQAIGASLPSRCKLNLVDDRTIYSPHYQKGDSCQQWIERRRRQRTMQPCRKLLSSLWLQTA